MNKVEKQAICNSFDTSKLFNYDNILADEINIYELFNFLSQYNITKENDYFENDDINLYILTIDMKKLKESDIPDFQIYDGRSLSKEELIKMVSIPFQVHFTFEEIQSLNNKVIKLISIIRG